MKKSGLKNLNKFKSKSEVCIVASTGLKLSKKM